MDTQLTFHQQTSKVVQKANRVLSLVKRSFEYVYYHRYTVIVKLQIFPYTCLFTFLVTIIIFGELTSTTSKERMTMNIIFADAAPIN